MDALHLVLGAALLVVGGLGWRERRARQGGQRDLVEQARKRDAMRRSLEHLTEGVVLLGPRNEVRYANPAAVALLGAGEAPEPGGQRVPLSRFTPLIHLSAMVDRSDESGTMRRVLEVRDGDDMPRALEVTLAPAGPGRRLLVVEDTRADAAVARKRRDFVANASHELKTPIAALIGLLDLLDQVPEDAQPELLERCRRNALSLSSMTDDLLGLSRAEDPDWRPAPRLMDLAAETEEVVDGFRDAAASKGLELELDTGGAGELLVDPDCYDTVLRNLLANAINYTQQGRVSVRLDPIQTGGMWVTVADTGPGIDASALPSIFERFFRGDPARSRASGGTGLGLSIVRNLLRRMGGRISVSSRDGEGSEFRVELPANPVRPLPGAGQPEFR